MRVVRSPLHVRQTKRACVATPPLQYDLFCRCPLRRRKRSFGFGNLTPRPRYRIADNPFIDTFRCLRTAATASPAPAQSATIAPLPRGHETAIPRHRALCGTIGSDDHRFWQRCSSWCTLPYLCHQFKESLFATRDCFTNGTNRGHVWPNRGGPVPNSAWVRANPRWGRWER